MRKAAPLLVLRLALFVALFASAVLLVEYNNLGDPAFCGVGSGCMAVRRSGYSSIGPVQLPQLGMAAYGALLVLALTARTWAHSLSVMLGAIAGGIGAVVLVVLQALVIKAFCKWCVIVDTSAVVAAIAAVVVHRQVVEGLAPQLPRRRALGLLWGGGAALAVALPVIWGEYPVVPPLPEAIAKLAVPGKVTIVSFTDFECPHCRHLGPVIHDIVAASPDRFALVRKMVPLPSHPGAMPAALAYVCVPEDAFAEVLYKLPEEQLSREGILALTRRAGIEEASLAACMDSPGAKARVELDGKLFESLEAKALPLTYIGPRMVLGADLAKVRKTAQLALEPARLQLPVDRMLAAFAFLSIALVGMTIRLIREAPLST